VPDSNKELPYDEGARAFKDRIPLGQNPYSESDWQCDEWDKGWQAEYDIDSNDSYDWSADKFKQN
jgi:hypothetical protein